MDALELKTLISDGLLSFPVTDFDQNGDFNAASYAKRLEWLAPYGASALFAAGGTGEFFSLTGDEYLDVIKTAVDTCKGSVPIIAGAGGPTRQAISQVQAAERLGAQGVLLMPHYLTEGSQEGLVEHVKQVCNAVDFGVIFYNRSVSKLNVDSLQQLVDCCPNLIGFKDSYGQIDLMTEVVQTLGDRLAYLGGLPTAEIFAAPYKALGSPVYSSAVFNFIPKTAMDFYRALRNDDFATTQRLIHDFFLPLIKIRNRKAGYAVSMIKAGAKIVGHDAGPVRPPLSDLTRQDYDDLAALIATLGPQ